MSTKCYCDRCEKEVNQSDLQKVSIYSTYLSDMDLCENCLVEYKKTLNKFMEKGEIQ